MTPAEYGRQLALAEPRITRDQARDAARILATVEPAEKRAA